MKIVFKKPKHLDSTKKIYECSNCKNLFNWGNESFWNGSINDLENDPKKIVYACSDKCRIELGDKV